MDNISDAIQEIGSHVIDQLVDTTIPPHSMEEEWDVEGLTQRLENDFHLRLPVREWLEQDNLLDESQLHARLQAAFKEAYQAKETQITPTIMRQFEKGVMLQTLDTCWREHLAAMDYLRQGIHLRGYAQKNPKQEYKRESFQLFAQLLDKVNFDVISALCKFEVKVENDIERLESLQRQAVNRQQMEYKHTAIDALQESDVAVQEERPVATILPFTRNAPKVGRNDPCPCGSGKKFKACHGKLE